MVPFVFLHIAWFSKSWGAEINPLGTLVTPEPPGVRGLIMDTKKLLLIIDKNAHFLVAWYLGPLIP